MPTILMPSRRATYHPYATIAIGVVTAIAFILETVAGGSQNNGTLTRMGASEHRLVWEHHQYFRLICPAFLHIGLMHIAANGYAFVQLAPFVERIWGSSRFLIVYLLSAVGGCFASSYFGHALSAGASGAIFGLLGFLISAGWSGRQRHEVRTLIQTYFGQGLILWAGFNLYLGIQPGSNVDNLGHMGGLAVGVILGTFLTGVVVGTKPVRAVAAACVLATLVAFGLCVAKGGGQSESVSEGEAPASPFEEAFEKARRTFVARDFDGATKQCEVAVRKATEPEEAVAAYALEGAALRELGRVDDAKLVFEVSYQTRPNVPAAAQLATIALVSSDAKGAVDWAEKAAKVSPKGRDVEPLAFVAVSLAERGQVAAALDALERLHKIAPRYQRFQDVDLAALESRLRANASPK